jgi:hypothetical protein
MEPKVKVYLVWLHDDVLEVCETFDGALKVIARAQGNLGGTWKRLANRWYQTGTVERVVSRLEIQMREVVP